MATTAYATLMRMPYRLRHDGAPLSVVIRDGSGTSPPTGVARWLSVTSLLPPIGATLPIGSKVGAEGVCPGELLPLLVGVAPGAGPANGASPIRGPSRFSLSSRSA